MGESPRKNTMEAVSAIDTKRPTRMVVLAYLAIAVSTGAFLERVIAATPPFAAV